MSMVSAGLDWWDQPMPSYPRTCEPSHEVTDNTSGPNLMDPSLMPPEEFEPLVVDALDALPDWVIPVVSEIAVIVEDEQSAAEARPGGMLLGIYRGFPRTRYSGRPSGSLPDTITLYRIPILLTAAGPEDVPARILKVLGHEVGHALGLSEARLRELGWY